MAATLFYSLLLLAFEGKKMSLNIGIYCVGLIIWCVFVKDVVIIQNYYARLTDYFKLSDESTSSPNNARQ